MKLSKIVDFLLPAIVLGLNFAFLFIAITQFKDGNNELGIFIFLMWILQASSLIPMFLIRDSINVDEKEKV